MRSCTGVAARTSALPAAPGPSLPAVWDTASASASPEASGIPIRPALSPLMAGAACAWAGVTLAGWAGMDAAMGRRWATLGPQTFLAVATLAPCIAVAVVLLAARGAGALSSAWMRWLAWAAVGLFAGVLSGSLFIGGVLLASEGLLAYAPTDCVLTVQTDPKVSAAGRPYFQASVVCSDGAAGRVWVDMRGDASELPSLGERLVCAGGWEELDLSDEFDRSLAQRGVCARLRANAWEDAGFEGGVTGAIRSFRREMLRAIDPRSDPGRALLAGVVCGDQASLGFHGVQDDFADLGLSHLVAVSGSHLVVVSALLGRVLAGARTRPVGRLVCTAVVLAVYVVFTGLQPSAIRSWVMAVAALGATAVGRRSHAPSSVSAAALALLLMSPSSACSMGFQLSVLSVLGLALFAGFAQEWLRCLLPAKTPRTLTEAFSLTTVAQVFTAPVALPAFGTLPWLSPIANAAAGPLVSLLLVVGLVGAPLAVLVPSVAAAALFPADVAARTLCLLSSFMAGLPGIVGTVEVDAWAIWLPVFLGAALLYAAWPKPSRRVARALLAIGLCCLLVAHLRWGVFAPARVVVLDVGQGDAILVQDGRYALLVDTGPGDAVVGALARNHIGRLDAVLITHTDLDHVGGIDDMVGRVEVGQVIVARGVAAAIAADEQLAASVDELVGEQVVEVAAGDSFAVGSFELDVLWPCEPVDGDCNEESVVALVSYGHADRDMSVLLTGDAERDVVEPLVELGMTGTVDVLKVGHHGSAVSTTSAMVEGLDPLVAVASAGENNRYGHPTEQCVSAIAGAGVDLHVTSACGDVDLRPVAGGVEIRCEHHQG